MFFYFPVKQKDGTVVGRVRVEEEKAVFVLSRPIDAEVYLFAGGQIHSLLPGDAVPAQSPEALLGIRDGQLVYSGRMPGDIRPPEQLLYELS